MNYKHLPHMDLKGVYQFVTFRTHDSTDAFLIKLELQNLENRTRQMKIDEYLDGSSEGSYLNGKALAYLADFLQAKDDFLYELIAFCIMPNHVHMLFKPLDELSMIMQRIKGQSSKELNEVLGRKGRFWLRHYYDKAIRDERHFELVYRYIMNNPLKLVLSDEKDVTKRLYGIYGIKSSGKAKALLEK